MISVCVQTVITKMYNVIIIQLFITLHFQGCTFKVAGAHLTIEL